MHRLVLSALIVGCGNKVKPPIEQAPPHAKDDFPGKPGTPTGNEAHLQCKGLTADPCQSGDFAYDATYDQAVDCTHGSDDAMHANWRNAADSAVKFGVHFAAYDGPGSYALDSATNYLEMAASVTRECPPTRRTAGLLAPKETCGNCTVRITDPDPQAPFPKPLEFWVTCPAMCEENKWKCGGVNMQLLSAPCRD
jgi:hypothetical protein